MSESALASGRAAAEARMTSRCTIRRAGGITTNADGYEVDGYADVVTETPCRLAGPHGGTSSSRSDSVGDVRIESAVRTLHLPFSLAGVHDGDLVEMTDGDSAGLVLQVVDSAPQDQATARRVGVFEVSRPEGWS